MDEAQSLPETAAARNAGGVDVKDVLGILGLQKRWVLGVPVALAVLALTYSVLAHPAYTSTAQVYVDPRDRHVPQENDVQNSVPGDGLLLVESQLRIITSDEVLTRVIEKAGLAGDPEFGGEANGLMARLKSALGIGSSPDRALTALRNMRLKTAAKRVDRSFVIDIMASADTPEKATMIANVLADSYLEEQANADAAFNRRTSEAINSRLENLRQAVRQSEEAVESFKAANNLVGSRTKLVTEQQLDEANTQLTTAKAKLAEAQSHVKLLETMKRGGGLDSVPEAVQSATIAQLRAQAASISREESQLAQQYGPNHPSLVAARAQQRDIQAAIDAELARIAQAARNEAARAQTNVQTLQASFDALKTLSQTNDKAMVPLRELERKAESNRVIYESFLAKAKTADEQQVIDTNNIRLISRATPPEQKSWPPTAILLGAALFAGLAIGIALALIREYFSGGRSARHEDDAVKTVAPLERTVPVASADATMPEQQETSSHPSLDVQLASLSADLKQAESGHVILLLRATADAAIPSLVLDLAEEANADGKNVIVIDHDFERHAVTSSFGFETRPGMQEILAGRALIYEVARYHRASNLNVVPMGIHQPPLAGDAAHQALAAALESARDFDLVIVDGGVFEAERRDFGLMALADEVIVVADARAGSEADVAQVIDGLNRRQIKARALFIGEDESVAA